MRTADLIEGRYYGYARSRRYGSLRRVKVVEADHTGTVRRGYRDEKRRGVLIEYPDGGGRDIVLPQTLKTTWADHQREVKAVEDRDRAARAEALAEIERNAAIVYNVHLTLLKRGVPIGAGSAFDEDVYAALLKMGFEPVEHMDHTVHSTIADLDAAVGEDRSIGTDLVGMALGIIPPRETPEYDYDLTDEEEAAQEAAFWAAQEAQEATP